MKENSEIELYKVEPTEDDYYFLTCKRPGSLKKGFDNYISNNASFKRFCEDVFDLSTELEEQPTHFRRYVPVCVKVEVVDETMIEKRALEGIYRVVDTNKGKVKIGFTRTRENRIYVKINDNLFLRGYRVFFGDLGLVKAMDYIPLDKNYGNGNIDIIEWNKEKNTKAIRFINNRIENIMYIVDMQFRTEKAMLEDIENPMEVNLTPIIQELMMD